MEDFYMSTKEISRFRELLLNERGEIIERINGLQATMALLNEPEKEIEEQAQRITASQAIDRLGADGRVKMKLIDLALRKMSLGDYGICESCGDDIALRRLEVLPWSRLCVECAREFERKGESFPEPEEALAQTSLPEEYADLTDQQLLRKIYDQVDRVLDVDKNLFKISVKRGIVYLEGEVEDEHERELILQTLTDHMGLGAIVDGLKTEESGWSDDEAGSRSIH
jgi:DnaK suppressor protein